MRVSATQNQYSKMGNGRTTQNQHKENNSFSPLKWATVGALAGYIVKNELPITEYEKEHLQFDDNIAKSNNSIKTAVQEEIDAIRKVIAGKKGRDEGYDLFLKYTDKNTDDAAKAKILKTVAKKSPKIKITFEDLMRQVRSKSEEVEAAVRISLNSTTNRMRPYTSYVGIGALLVTSAAFVWHVLSRMASEPEV